MSAMDGLSYVSPVEIEKKSFEIISEELGEHNFNPIEELVVKRVIHATADFDYATLMSFTDHAIEAGIAALQKGATVVCDTTMVAAGINKRVLESFGGEVRCFIADPDVAAEARDRDVTRSAVAMERATSLSGPLVFAIGNAPTALVRLIRMIEHDVIAAPALVIGVPVGFVNVVESKELAIAAPVESIVSRGRKGGSTVAAAIVNALLYQASGGRREAR